MPLPRCKKCREYITVGCPKCEALEQLNKQQMKITDKPLEELLNEWKYADFDRALDAVREIKRRFSEMQTALSWVNSQEDMGR